ncbi:autophagy-related protein 9A-like isoform X2 [Ostrea edulis]|uniref:autophagy-related protein 9A-like isoform X2 n=1 Tax=Ostrea edulis TaxID=37623 RepID=UPI0024AF1291|nr:autophagy-related protein 9A-like isoform X2 [Ostrea edulis]XP_056007905.1 autophagy-related protein 9A-like isoform X2 [Ostrea edulis]
MAEYQTQYQPLGSCEDDTDENDAPTTESANLMIHVVQESTRWNHIENLDEFFTRVYHYHQRGGFVCMMLSDILQLVQFLFVVGFSTFLLECVNYDILFANSKNDTHKVTIPEAVLPFGQCVKQFDFGIVVSLLVASTFWLFRLIKVLYNIFKYWEIRSFYLTALNISTTDLTNMTWHEVQRCLLEVQKEQQMCIHKQELTELDIYHRILRFKNYMIAMERKSLMPLRHNIPFIGECAFYSIGLKYNLDFILFWGPWSPFENYWKLKDEYKIYHKRKQLAEELSKRIMWIGIANFAFSPLILMWQILYSFFRYADTLKREPSMLGSRRWSNYARLYLRHYNELDHEFDARLNRGYRLANKYMDIFTSQLIVLVAKNVAFFAGSVLAVLVVLTVIDEDVLAVEHVLTTMTVAGLIVTACKVFIPDEHLVYCPEILMRNILAHVHYMPPDWSGNAHTSKVRNEFSIFFQYKVVYLLEELLSPLVTPFVLCFSLRHKSTEIVDFFRNFTVDVVGVGDVCSFAQMDVRKRDNKPQNVEESAEPQAGTNVFTPEHCPSQEGKIEMSLMHFHLTNPEWKPPQDCSLFINDVKEQAQRDPTSLSIFHPVTQNMMSSSQGSLTGYLSGLQPSGAGGMGYTSMASSVAVRSGLYPNSTQVSMAPSVTGIHHRLRGALSAAEGPLDRSISGPFTNMQASTSMMNSGYGFHSLSSSKPSVDEGSLELMSHDMSVSALYLHDLQSRKMRGQSQIGGYDNLEDIRARNLWQRQDSNQGTGHFLMPNIQEKMEEAEGDCSHPVTKSV